MKKIYHIAIVLLGSMQLMAQNPLNLDACRSMAVENNKELKNAKSKTEEAKHYEKAAKTAYLPSVKAEASYMRMMDVGSFATPGGFLPTAESEEAALSGQFSGQSNVYSPGMTIDIGDIDIINGGISVSQPIYAGGKIITANKQAKTGVEMSELGFDLARADVIQMTDNAFWTIVSVSSNIELANEYIAMLSELEQKMDDMYDLGIVPASEKLKVSVKKNEAEYNLMRAENGLRLAKMRLNQIIGQDLNTPINLQVDDSSAIVLPDLGVSPESAMQNRNEIKIMEKKVAMSTYEKQLAMADYLPSAGIALQYTGAYVSDFAEELTFKPMLAAQISIPLFSWGQGHQKQQAAKLKVLQAETDYQNTTELIRLEVLSKQVELEEAYEAVMLAEKNLKEAKESLDETQASFDVGLNTTSDLLTAQADWQKASSNVSLAKAQFRISETNWKRATGVL